MARYKFPSIARLAEHFNIDEAKATTLRAVLLAISPSEVRVLVPTVHPRNSLDHTVLAAVDILIGGYGFAERDLVHSTLRDLGDKRLVRIRH